MELKKVCERYVSGDDSDKCLHCGNAKLAHRGSDFEVCTFTSCYIRHEVLKKLEKKLDREEVIEPGSVEHDLVTHALDV